MKTAKEMKQEIREKYRAIPEMQVSTGRYIHTIGNKFIIILNIWLGTKLEKVDINDFYNEYMK